MARRNVDEGVVISVISSLRVSVLFDGRKTRLRYFDPISSVFNIGTDCVFPLPASFPQFALRFHAAGLIRVIGDNVGDKMRIIQQRSAYCHGVGPGFVNFFDSMHLLPLASHPVISEPNSAALRVILRGADFYASQPAPGKKDC